MPNLKSVGAAFAAALVSQAESAPARTILVRLPLVQDTSTPLTTSDATRGAFASSLHEYDAVHAPPLVGPYVPGFAAVSGPLTDADIYDPSQLYSMPERGVALFSGANSDGAVAASVRQTAAGFEPTRMARLTPDTQAPLAAYFDQDGPDDESAALASRPVDLQGPQPHPGVETRIAFVDRPPQELNAVQLAAYLDLMRTGLFPSKRKEAARARAKDALREATKRRTGPSWGHDPDGFDPDLFAADMFDTASDEMPRRRSGTAD